MQTSSIISLLLLTFLISFSLGYGLAAYLYIKIVNNLQGLARELLDMQKASTDRANGLLKDMEGIYSLLKLRNKQ